MKLKYSLDIDKKSIWLVNTPDETSKSLPFYVDEWGHYIAHSTYFTERQKQKNFLLIYTVKGNGYLKYMNREYVLQPRQAVVINCDNYHFYKTLSASWDFKWFHFNGTAAKEHYKILSPDSMSITTVKDPAGFEKALDNLSLCLNSYDIVANIKASKYVTDALSDLISSKFSAINNKKYTEHRNEIEKVITFIQQNYTEKIILDDLTRLACMSKYHFLRLFKDYIGTSPYDYLLNYRITKAKELLHTTGHTVGEISFLIGYSDCNNFIREFKKNTGTTPFQYRQNNL